MSREQSSNPPHGTLPSAPPKPPPPPIIYTGNDTLTKGGPPQGIPSYGIPPRRES